MLKFVIKVIKVIVYHKFVVSKVTKGLTYNVEVISLKPNVVFKILFFRVFALCDEIMDPI